MIPVDEIFGPALQGEGIHMGVPSVFVRTGGCNFTCSGFGCSVISPLDNETKILGCDSIHAVNVKHFRHTWTYYDKFNELVKDIEKCFGDYNDKYSEKIDIIFTGGEPLLHHKDNTLLETVEYFVSRGHRVFFETNGTQDIDFDLYPIYKQVSFSMSIKMSNSGEPEHKRWRPDIINKYLRNTKNSYFKFVLTKEQCDVDAPEIFKFLEQIPTWGLVYCMPQGETSKAIDKNAKAVYEFCLKNGFRYSDRIHIRIYEDLRAV